MNKAFIAFLAFFATRGTSSEILRELLRKARAELEDKPNWRKSRDMPPSMVATPSGVAKLEAQREKEAAERVYPIRTFSSEYDIGHTLMISPESRRITKMDVVEQACYGYVGGVHTKWPNLDLTDLPNLPIAKFPAGCIRPVAWKAPSGGSVELEFAEELISHKQVGTHEGHELGVPAPKLAAKFNKKVRGRAFSTITERSGWTKLLGKNPLFDQTHDKGGVLGNHPKKLNAYVIVDLNVEFTGRDSMGKPTTLRATIPGLHIGQSFYDKKKPYWFVGQTNGRSSQCEVLTVDTLDIYTELGQWNAGDDVKAPFMVCKAFDYEIVLGVPDRKLEYMDHQMIVVTVVKPSKALRGKKSIRARYGGDKVVHRDPVALLGRSSFDEETRDADWFGRWLIDL